MKDTYSIEVRCRNCEECWIKDIKKGVGVLVGYECPNCGCNEGVFLGSYKRGENKK